MSTKVIAPSTAPGTSGAKLTVTVQVVPGARLDPQVVEFGNSPLTVTLVTLSVLVVLVFFSVMVWLALVVPRPCAAKLMAAGVRLAVWPSDATVNRHTDTHRQNHKVTFRFIRVPRGEAGKEEVRFIRGQ